MNSLWNVASPRMVRSLPRSVIASVVFVSAIDVIVPAERQHPHATTIGTKPNGSVNAIIADVPMNPRGKKWSVKYFSSASRASLQLW